MVEICIISWFTIYLHFLNYQQTAKHFGASTASVAMKLGLVFPLSFQPFFITNLFLHLKLPGQLQH
jgi:hypothetical protein